MLQTFLFYLDQLLPKPGAPFPDEDEGTAKKDKSSASGRGSALDSDMEANADASGVTADGSSAASQSQKGGTVANKREPIYVPFRDLAQVIDARARSGSKVMLDTNETEQLEKVFVFAAVWAFGSTLSERDGVDWRRRFSDWFRSAFKSIHFASRETVFDYWLNPYTGKFDQWKDSPLFHSVTFDSQTMSIGSITVPTPETCALEYWARMLIEKQRAVMFVGPAGTGKS